MTKYDLAKLFGDVDDRFIEDVKPEVQHGIKLQVKKSSPIKAIAAAACAAAFAGGIVTANVVNKYSSVFDNGSKTASLQPNNGGMANNSFDNWFDDEQIYYEGNYYKVPKESLSAYKIHVDEKLLAVLTGIRRISPNSIEMVTVMVNHSTGPLNIRCYGADSVVEMKFAPERGHAGETQIPDDMESKPFGHTLQPGEMCFQKEVYSADCGNYEGEIKFAYSNADPSQQGRGGASRVGFYIVMTEDGFKEHYEVESENSAVSPSDIGELDLTTDLDGDGIPDAYKEANPDITPEQWEIIKDAWAHEREPEQKD